MINQIDPLRFRSGLGYVLNERVTMGIYLYGAVRALAWGIGVQSKHFSAEYQNRHQQRDSRARPGLVGPRGVIEKLRMGKGKYEE